MGIRIFKSYQKAIKRVYMKGKYTEKHTASMQRYVTPCLGHQILVCAADHSTKVITGDATLTIAHIQ